MKNKLEDTVNYLQFVDCALYVVKQTKLQDRPPQ